MRNECARTVSGKGGGGVKASLHLGLVGGLGVDVCEALGLLLRFLARLLAVEVLLEAMIGQGFVVVSHGLLEFLKRRESGVTSDRKHQSASDQSGHLVVHITRRCGVGQR